MLEANTPAPILNAVNSIAWAQQLVGLPKMSEHPMVAASQRIFGKPKTKKEPITPEMLTALVKSKISESSKTDQFRDGAWDFDCAIRPGNLSCEDVGALHCCRGN